MTVRAEAAKRVAALRQAGIVPGLAVVLVGGTRLAGVCPQQDAGL